jgi:hypothetical protein
VERRVDTHEMMPLPSPCSFVSRAVSVFAVVGLGVVGAVAMFGDGAIASISGTAGNARREWSCVAPFGRVTPSPDGIWVAVDRLTNDPDETRVALIHVASGGVRDVEISGFDPVQVPWSDGLLRMRSLRDGASVLWIDPQTLDVVRTTHDGAAFGQVVSAVGDGWSSREDVKGSNGRAARRIVWKERGLAADFESSVDRPVNTTKKPGIVFVGRRGLADTAIVRCELDGERTREIARIARQDTWSASPDAERVAICAAGALDVRDANDGRVVATLASAGLAFWVGDGSRWLAATHEGSLVLHDLEAGTSLRLFEYSPEECLSIHVLDGDRILAQQGENVLLFEHHGTVPRLLFPPAS